MKNPGGQKPGLSVTGITRHVGVKAGMRAVQTGTVLFRETIGGIT